MGDIAVREDYFLDAKFPNQRPYIGLRINWDPLGIQAPSQSCRINPILDMRNLCGRECHHLVSRIVTVARVEIMGSSEEIVGGIGFGQLAK
jgi:hypothetical protein